MKQLIALMLIVVGAAPMVSADEPKQPAKPIQVMIDNFRFSPKELTIPVGATVTWVNHDDVPHTATSKSDPPAFDSKALDTDQVFSFKFTKPGTYKYYCKLHTHMMATVIVK
jgi:plastocyanin